MHISERIELSKASDVAYPTHVSKIRPSASPTSQIYIPLPETSRYLHIHATSVPTTTLPKKMAAAHRKSYTLHTNNSIIT